MLVGSIDNEAEFSTLGFSDIKKIVFNFEGFRLISSSGIQTCIKFFSRISESVSIEFVRSPLRIISQINLVLGFLFSKTININSFFAPNSCEECDDSKQILLETKAHFHNFAAAAAPALNCDLCKKEIDFGGLEKKNFLFSKRLAA